MGKKKTGIFLAVLILISLAAYYFYNSKVLYGNNKASIVKVINSIDSFKNKEIEILDINDVDDLRIVGLSNNSPSYIEFNKNQKGNYVWQRFSSHNNDSFSMFLPLKGSPKCS
ncbi:hypothetical protein HNQ94_003434 [Salirhabdus euzebyi]|uniref:Uncharacterized protein n=1 Tax=Salirhabdus euzebyi TaxID=394506 RepID=A0A841Q997_9BACI|nr:hypothetical protein [Salirhabdus euzebyi]MBB6454945.1 hypothetical protein [Salirhabdus euzebyi]